MSDLNILPNTISPRALDNIEIMKPNGENVPVTVLSLYNEEGEVLESAPHPKQVVYIELSSLPDKYDLLRVKKEENV